MALGINLEPLTVKYQAVHASVAAIPEYAVGSILPQLANNKADDLIFKLDSGGTFHAQSERFPDHFAPSSVLGGLKAGDPIVFRGQPGRVIAYQDDSTSLGERFKKGVVNFLGKIGLMIGFHPS